MSTYEHDGTVFDLDRTYLDVTGTEWSWSGEWTATGPREPLMQSEYRGRPDLDSRLTLPDLYHLRGPLIVVRAPVSAEARRAVLAAPSPGFAATAAAGYVEDLTAYTHRTRGTA